MDATIAAAYSGPMSTALIGIIQLSCSSDEAANWESARELIERAAGSGARLVATPENTNFLGPHPEKVRRAEPLDGPTCNRFADLAARLGITLLLGSFNECSPNPRRCYNTSVLFAPDGSQLAHYRKIHLFDVDLSDEVRFVESETVRAGTEVVVAKTALGALGLSVCYDLRFPELYSRLTAQGAEILCVPAAFTATTGPAHWEVLLRARAIETQCFVLAPAQVGKHDDEGLRESHGHAMVVDPWGQIIASIADGPGFALAEIDLRRLREIRRAMPVEEHRRLGP